MYRARICCIISTLVSNILQGSVNVVEIIFAAVSHTIQKLVIFLDTVTNYFATLDNVLKLVKDMEDSNFPSFCRLLSTTIVDIDYSEERVTCKGCFVRKLLIMASLGYKILIK